MKLIFTTYTDTPTPVFYLKPDTALLRNHSPFFYPDFTDDVRAELALVLRICRLGRSINVAFATRYFDAVGIGLSLTACDILAQCVRQGLPQDCARAFDFAAPIGTEFMSIAEIGDIGQCRFGLSLNGEFLHADAPRFRYSVGATIAHVSQFLTLRTGDYLFLNTSLVTGTLHVGDELRASLNGAEQLKMRIH
ncbi:MAG: fumarylacetoacetate hydrolase family protein [Prevotellaceae bacterium]|jgi:2-keto-4-pentenoate hydratase/2-oxohepta-3-ene-1,7-dioic acid hydratase in catechol pathway|nr:fumarylacetoacetate hydrolase family protein [Prevotellaceae bacterium]